MIAASSDSCARTRRFLPLVVLCILGLLVGSQAQALAQTQTNTQGLSKQPEFTSNVLSVAPGTTTPAPVLTVNDNPNYVLGGSAIIVAPTLTITGSGTLDGAIVLIDSNFASGEDVLGIQGQAGSSGTVNGIAWSYNAGTGVLTFSGTASLSTYQDALRMVTYDNTNSSPSTLPRGVRFSLGSSLPNSETDHYYEFVVADGIHWDVAKTAASGRSLFGLQGYLTTITSANENAFVASKLAGQGWMGASDDPSQGASEGHWFWATGPEAGTEFWNTTVGAVNGAYINWNSGEPNNCCGSENYAHFLVNGRWNDYALTTHVSGYVVEYGGMPGDPNLQISGAATVSFTLNAPTLTNPPAINAANKSAYPVSGTCEPGATVTIDVGGVTTTVTCSAGGTYSTTIDVSGLADGVSVPISVTQTVGSITSPPATATVRKDTVAPAAPTINSPGPINASNKSAYPVSGTCEPGATLTISVGGVTKTVVCSAGGTYSTTINVSGLPDGANIPINVTQTDAGGNTSPPAHATTLKDTGALPPPTITSPADVDVNNQIVAGMSEPNSTVTVVIDLDNNPATTNDRVTYRVTADSSGHWSLNIKTATPVSGIMPVGGLTLPSTAGVTATASDNAGNTSSATRGELRVRWLIYYPLFIEVN